MHNVIVYIKRIEMYEYDNNVRDMSFIYLACTQFSPAK